MVKNLYQYQIILKQTELGIAIEPGHIEAQQELRNHFRDYLNSIILLLRRVGTLVMSLRFFVLKYPYL